MHLLYGKYILYAGVGKTFLVTQRTKMLKAYWLRKKTLLKCVERITTPKKYPIYQISVSIFFQLSPYLLLDFSLWIRGLSVSHYSQVLILQSVIETTLILLQVFSIYSFSLLQIYDCEWWKHRKPSSATKNHNLRVTTGTLVKESYLYVSFTITAKHQHIYLITQVRLFRLICWFIQLLCSLRNHN